MEKIMKFEINNEEWEIFIVDNDSIKNRYNEEYDNDATFVFGITLYPEHQIWINESMCEAQKLRTLWHELTHCYVWSFGLNNAPNFTEEMLCDIVAASHGIIERIVMEFVENKNNIFLKK